MGSSSVLPGAGAGRRLRLAVHLPGVSGSSLLDQTLAMTAAIERSARERDGEVSYHPGGVTEPNSASDAAVWVCGDPGHLWEAQTQLEQVLSIAPLTATMVMHPYSNEDARVPAGLLRCSDVVCGLESDGLDGAVRMTRHLLDIASRCESFEPAAGGHLSNDVLALRLLASRLPGAVRPAVEARDGGRPHWEVISRMHARLAEVGDSQEALLGRLTQQGMLSASMTDRRLICPECESLSLRPIAVSPCCESTLIVPDIGVHHYECGSVRSRSEFLRGDTVRCPSCSRTVQEAEIEFGRTIKGIRCVGCDRFHEESRLHILCEVCGGVHALEILSGSPLHEYRLTHQGSSVAASGRLANVFDISSLIGSGARFVSSEEFLRLVRLELGRHGRHPRPLTVLRGTVVGLDRLLSDSVDALQQGVETYAGFWDSVLRVTDVITALDEHRFVLMLTDTREDQVEAFVERIGQSLRNTPGLSMLRVALKVLSPSAFTDADTELSDIAFSPLEDIDEYWLSITPEDTKAFIGPPDSASPS